MGKLSYEEIVRFTMQNLFNFLILSCFSAVLHRFASICFHMMGYLAKIAILTRSGQNL